MQLKIAKLSAMAAPPTATTLPVRKRSALAKLASFAVTRRRWVILAWVLLLGSMGAVGKAYPALYSNSISIPGAESFRAADILDREFPSEAGDLDQIVVHTANGQVTDPATRKRVDEMLAQVAELGKRGYITDVVSPYSERAKSQISADGRTAFANVTFSEYARDLPKPAIQKVVDTAKAASGNGLQVELGGQAITYTEQAKPAPTEAIGLAAAVVILLLTFGSVVAMGLPVITALFGLGVGLSLVGVVSRVVDTADFAPQLAAMIGLGVGIDYALFIVSRFRDAYAKGHGDLKQAVEEALDSAGRSVLFAGLVVVISILGMILLGVQFLYGVAVCTSIVVLITVASALTLTPALLGFERIGGRIGSLRVKNVEAGREGQMWARWSDAVVKRRWLCAIGGTAVLVALAIPALSMHQMHNDAGNGSPSLTTRKAYDLLAAGFGPGFNGPFKILVQPTAKNDVKAAQKAVQLIAATPGIGQVSAPVFSPSKKIAVITAYVKTSPQDEATESVVKQLRADAEVKLKQETGASMLVGGFTPATVDLANFFGKKLPLFIGVVVLLSALLLVLVFRSILVPVKAALMNLLSIGSALGVVTLVFQKGYGAGLLGVEKGPIEPFLPVMMFAIVFGLSMDYEVFIVSRIREEWTKSGDPRDAVRKGLAATGRVVTAAAAIMVLVFASFMFGDDKIIKMFGLGLATAVFLDAFLIRVILLPAVMDLAANVTWWLPAWLDRLLPHVGIEAPAEPDADED